MNSETRTPEGSGESDCYAARVAKIKSLPHESLMVAYLMETGWRLHVSADNSFCPRVIRVVTVGRSTTITMEDVSHDVVIDLVNAELIAQDPEYAHHRNVETVYKWSA